MLGKRKIAAIAAEFIGTGVLTLLVLSVQRSTIGVAFFIALAAGLAVLLMSFALAAYSGGYFNPALTLGLWTARKVSTVTAIVFIIAQLLGGFAAYALFKYFSNAPVQAIGGTFTFRIMTAEFIGTLVFSFGFASAVYQRFSSAVSASVAGLSLTLGIVAASSASAAILNPAVALGTRAWELGTLATYGTYLAGPVLGALAGVNLYRFVFAPVVSLAPAEATVATVVKPARNTKSVAAPAKKKPVAKKAAPKKKAPAKKK